MDVIMTVMLISFITPIIGALLAHTRLSNYLTAMLVRVWESIMILFGRTPKPVVPHNVKMTLDEMGLTLEQASDAHYDAKTLQTFRMLHAREHQAWDNEFNSIERLKWMLENDDPDIVDEAPRSRKTTKITHRNGMTHKSTEVCYKCERI